jgi:hypothetical protein
MSVDRGPVEVRCHQHGCGFWAWVWVLGVYRMFTDEFDGNFRCS